MSTNRSRLLNVIFVEQGIIYLRGMIAFAGHGPCEPLPPKTVYCLWYARSAKEEQKKRDKLKAGLKLFQFEAHRLRAFFVNTASQLDVDDRDIKAYIGHSAPDILGKHYLKVKDSKMTRFVYKMNEWRGLIAINATGHAKSARETVG